MNTQTEKERSSTTYKEVKIGRTVYRVTSIFTGEKDLGETLEQLAVRRAMAEINTQKNTRAAAV